MTELSNKRIPKQIKRHLVQTEIADRRVSGRLRGTKEEAHTAALVAKAEAARVEKIRSTMLSITYTLAEAKADYVESPHETVIQFWARQRWEMAQAIVDMENI